MREERVREEGGWGGRGDVDEIMRKRTKWRREREDDDEEKYEREEGNGRFGGGGGQTRENKSAKFVLKGC